MDDVLKDILENGDYDCSILNVSIDKDIERNLLEYQVLHVQNLIGSLEKNNIVIDTSDTGCGKTYCSLAVCKQMKLEPIIICPKSIISNWRKICDLFNIKPVFVCNYESIRKGKYYENGDMNNRKKCPYLRYIKKDKSHHWKNIKKNNIFIFDEVHFCKNKSSLNGKLLISTMPYKKMLLSATLVDDISSFEIFTYMLGWCDSLRRVKSYLIAETNGYKNFKYISKRLYPKFASRISIAELGDRFPKNNVIIDTYDDDNLNLIDEEYQKIKEYYKKLDEKAEKCNKANLLVDISFSRQKIELYKVEIINDLVGQYLENKFSIVIFVNYNKTLEILAHILETTCIVNGKQSYEERIRNIEDFQSNKKKVIICNIQAGGQSINLHDVHGGHPRVSLIVPSFSSTLLIQALGRINRAGSKSPSTQRIIFCSGTVEQHIAKRLKEKVKNLSSLNDTDLGIF